MTIDAIPRAHLYAAFVSKVIVHAGCWDWAGARHNCGYGILSIRGKNVYAHRASYVLHKGTIPSGLDVIHECHNPVCSNPQHLTVGTRAANMATSKASGRLARKIHIDCYADIMCRRAAGQTFKQIGRAYGVWPQAIAEIIKSHGLDDTRGRRTSPDTTITFNGTTRTLREWADLIGIDRHTLRFRYVRKKWSAERALTEPIARGPKASRKRLHP